MAVVKPRLVPDRHPNTPEIVEFLESLMSCEADEAIDLLTNNGEEVLDRWYEQNHLKV